MTGEACVHSGRRRSGQTIAATARAKLRELHAEAADQHRINVDWNKPVLTNGDDLGKDTIIPFISCRQPYTCLKESRKLLSGLIVLD